MTKKNKFQVIKELITNRSESGKEVINMSIGQPHGPAALIAREACAEAVMSSEESMHEYQDNSVLPEELQGSDKLFAVSHVRTNSGLLGNIDVCLIPGIKPTIPYAIQACKDKKGRDIKVGVVSGYPTYQYACSILQGVDFYVMELNSKNGFKLSVDDIQENTDMLIVNYPHNPSGQVFDKMYWYELCTFCEADNICLVNDGAYSLLSWGDSSTLADTAHHFLELDWIEFFSASKITNFTGWRAGVIIGSYEFVEFFKSVKGNMDSGLPAFVVAGVMEIFYTEEGREIIHKNREMYRGRSKHLSWILTLCGMQLAITPQGTFFVLFKAPQTVFGQEIGGDAQKFNEIMIKETGVVGVPFDDCIRYCVTLDVCKEEISEKIKKAFEKAQVSY